MRVGQSLDFLPSAASQEHLHVRTPSGRHTVIRSLHDLGLAAWFGGSLMGAVGLNGAARQEGATDASKARIVSAGWTTWMPVSAAAIGAHLYGGGGLLAVNAHRLAK